VQPRRSCSLAVWLKVLRQAELGVSPKSLSRWTGFKAGSSGGALHLGLNKDEAAQLPGSARLLLPRRVAGAWSPTRGSAEQGERGSIWLSPRSFSGIPVYLEQAGARTTRNAGSRRMPVTLFATPLIPTYPPATPTAKGATDRTVTATRATKRSCPVVTRTDLTRRSCFVVSIAPRKQPGQEIVEDNDNWFSWHKFLDR
jgi:hypothetical protein